MTAPDEAFDRRTGDRIQLVAMDADHPCPVPPGSTGTIVSYCTIEGIEQIHVRQDDPARRLALLPGVDAFCVLR